MSELILCVTNSLFRPRAYIQTLDMIQLKNALHLAEFKDRDSLETCEYITKVQVIPYTVIEFRGSILRYQRTKFSGESQLVEKYSIGVGGHVSIKDTPADRRFDEIALKKSAMREITEEIGFKGISMMLQFIGLIYYPNTDVGQRHVGIVMKYEIPEDSEWGLDCLCIENCLTKVELIPVQELVAGKLDMYEDWSKMVIKDCSL